MKTWSFVSGEDCRRERKRWKGVPEQANRALPWAGIRAQANRAWGSDAGNQQRPGQPHGDKDAGLMFKPQALKPRVQCLKFKLWTLRIENTTGAWSQQHAPKHLLVVMTEAWWWQKLGVEPTHALALWIFSSGHFDLHIVKPLSAELWARMKGQLGSEGLWKHLILALTGGKYFFGRERRKRSFQAKPKCICGDQDGGTEDKLVKESPFYHRIELPCGDKRNCGLDIIWWGNLNFQPCSLGFLLEAVGNHWMFVNSPCISFL